jgi:hypothetical protein
MYEGLSSLSRVYPDSPVENTKECFTDSLISNLKRKQLRAQSELDSVTAALTALEKNPEIANLLELISKAGN